MPSSTRFGERPKIDPKKPHIYNSAGVVFPVGTIVGNPASYTYRVLWSQVIPRRNQIWRQDMMPFVTTDRSIVLKYGYGEPALWGTPHILSTLVLQTPTLCCVHLHIASYDLFSGLWWYCRVTPRDLHTIQWDAMSKKEHDLFTAAVRQEPLRSSVAGRDSEYQRASVIYRYPVESRAV